MRLASFIAALLAMSCATTPPAQPSKPALAAATTAPAPPTPPTLRLPTDVVPVRVSLSMTVLPEEQTATGTTHIELEVVKPTSTVWLNGNGLKVSSASIGGTPATISTAADAFIGLTVPAPLATGHTVVELAFTAPITRGKSQGLYAEKEGADTYAYTFFEALDARRAFPCFDEPSAKVPWTLSLTVKKAHEALANMPVASVEPRGDGLKTVTFEETPPLPSYLVAFVVGPFEVVEGGLAGRKMTPIRFIIPKGRAGELGYAREVTPKVVKALEDWFDTDFPMKKLDVAVVPRFWGTMEHPGIVAMGQPMTLIRPEEDTRPRREFYANILSHELAHYWFGDLVTMAWWDDTWLNEALGEYVDPIITDAAEPAWKVREKRLGAEGAKTADEQLATQRIRLPVESTEAIQSSFDGEITYQKGAAVLQMFEAYVGPEMWRAFLRGYLKRHAWKNATSTQLLTELRAELGDFPADGLASFLDQPGLPLITVTASCADGKGALNVSQRRSFPAGVAAPAEQLWTVPVCLRWGTASSSERLCVALKERTMSVPVRACSTWALLNDGGTGYYRSAITAATANQLLEVGPAGRRAALTSPERRVLLADLVASHERAEVPLDEAVAVAAKEITSPDDLTAIAAIEAIMGLVPNQLPGALAEQRKTYLRSLCGPLAGRLGWTRTRTDSDDRQMLRRLALWCAASTGDQASIKAGAIIGARYLQDPAKLPTGVADDVVGQGLCALARTGTSATFDALVKAADRAHDRRQKTRFLSALGCFTTPDLNARALALVGSTDQDLRDTTQILSGAMWRDETREPTWTWVKANVDGLLSRMRSDESSWFVRDVSSPFCDEGHRAEVDALLTERAKKIDGAQTQLARGLGEVDRCIAQVKRELPAYGRLFKGKVAAPAPR